LGGTTIVVLIDAKIGRIVSPESFSLLALFFGDLWGHYLLLRVNKVIELHSVILPTLTFQDGAGRALVVKLIALKIMSGEVTLYGTRGAIVYYSGTVWTCSTDNFIT